jgi:hypothetical protein
MEALKQAVRTALPCDAAIQRDVVRRWIRTASDVEEDALLYRLTDQARERIEPDG